MIQQRVETILTTFALIGFSGVLHIMVFYGTLSKFPYLSTVMLTFAAIYIFGGCVLQTFGHKIASLALGVVTFFVLCTALFYSEEVLDFIVFFICMALVIRKSSHTCNCMSCGENPLA